MHNEENADETTEVFPVSHRVLIQTITIFFPSSIVAYAVCKAKEKSYCIFALVGVGKVPQHGTNEPMHLSDLKQQRLVSGSYYMSTRHWRSAVHQIP